jgi:hypothetical protein
MNPYKAKWAVLSSLATGAAAFNILGCHFSDWTKPLFPGPLRAFWNILFLNPMYQWATNVFDI